MKAKDVHAAEVQLAPARSTVRKPPVQKGSHWRRSLSGLRRLTLEPDFWSNYTVVISFVALCIAFEIAQPKFLSGSNVQNVLAESTPLVVLAVGQSLVIMTAGIDLSQAAVLTVAAMFLGEVTTIGSGWLVPACLVSIATGALLGGLNGLVIGKVGITDFVVTLGMLGVASGISQVITLGAPIVVVDGALLRFASGSVAGIGYPVFVALLVVLAAHWALYHTRFGTHLLATGGNRVAARAMGVRVDRVRIAAYLLSGTLVGLAAIIYTAQIAEAEAAPNTTLLLDAIAATVLGGVSLFGGRGTIAGPALGALLLTGLSNGLTLMSVSAYYQPLVVGIVVVGAAAAMRFQRG